MLAQVEGTSLTDLIRQAVEGFAAEKRDEPALRSKAAEMLDELDHETEAHRGAARASR